GQRTGAADAGHVEDEVDLAERVARGGKHPRHLILFRNVAPEGHDVVTELGGRLLLAPADVGREHSGSLAHEHPRGPPRPPPSPPRHPASRAGDDRDLADELRHQALPSVWLDEASRSATLTAQSASRLATDGR